MEKKEQNEICNKITDLLSGLSLNDQLDCAAIVYMSLAKTIREEYKDDEGVWEYLIEHITGVRNTVLGKIV